MIMRCTRWKKIINKIHGNGMADIFNGMVWHGFIFCLNMAVISIQETFTFLGNEKMTDRRNSAESFILTPTTYLPRNEMS